MTDSPKSFTYARSAKSPWVSSQSSSRTVTSKGDQQYNPVKREWATSTKPDSFQRHSQCQVAEKTTVYQPADAQYLDPVGRWEKESLHQSPWSNIASYRALSDTMSNQSNQEMEGQEDNWSMTGNAQSEK